MTVAPGEVVTVTITADNYGPLGAVTETLPAGFDYRSSAPVDGAPGTDPQMIRFTLLGEKSFTYTVTVSDTPGSYSFSGMLRDSDRTNYPVGGDSMVTVEADAPEPTPAPSASRDISPTTVGPGEVVTVTITPANYGDFGGVTETLPAGFNYVSSSIRDSQVAETGQDVRFTLQDEDSFTYTVNASDTPGSYTFSGKLRDDNRDDYDVGGASSVTVEADTPSASRGISPGTVAPGGRVTVTITSANYGDFGGVTETLPAGFDYVSSSLRDSQVTETGQDVRFTLQDEDSFRYTVTASDTPGSYTFRGKLRDDNRDDYDVGGASRVTVRRASPPVPTPNRDPAFPGSSTTRSVDENSAAGANVGARVSATDRDGDRLTYALSGTDASSFTINSSGQIMVGTGTMLDFEDKASYMVTVRATDPDGADDTISVTVAVTNVDEDGTVTLSEMRPRVGRPVTASLDDPDGGVTGAAWQWASSDPMGGTFVDIAGATSASYTPVDGDVDMYLIATVMYDDGHGMDKDAMSMATDNPVVVAPLDMCIEPLGALMGPVTRMGTWASDCMSQARSGSYAEYYTFTLDSGTQVEINLTSGVDAYLALRQGAGRDGTMVGSNDNVGSRNFNSAINMMLAAGDYTVEATTYFAKQTGDFTLSVRPLQETEDLGELAGSVDRSNSMWVSDYMSTQQAGSYARSYTFTVDTATHVAINLTSPEDSYLYVLDSNGAVVHENDNVTTRNLNSRIDQILQPGTYTIEATTYHPARMGTFHLSIGVLP